MNTQENETKIQTEITGSVEAVVEDAFFKLHFILTDLMKIVYIP